VKFRQARHTNQLEPIIRFYTEIIGLKELGSFKNHEGYDGVFIGTDQYDNTSGWHLEFTVSWEMPIHRVDEDDLLVFYPSTESIYKDIILRIRAANLKPFVPKNPYWRRNGICILDPDGYGVVIVTPKN